MIYAFIVICILLYAFGSEQLLLSLGVSESHMIGCFTYEMSHASWVHLLVNALSLLLMFNPVLYMYQLRVKDTNSGLFFLVCYAIALLAGIITCKEIVTVGASGIVFCLLGMLIILNPTIKQLRSYIYVAAAVVIQIISGHSNVALHIVAFILGALYVIIRIYGVERRRLYKD